MATYTRHAGRRTSSFSDQGQGCVAVDFLGHAGDPEVASVEITHSKIANSPAIHFTPAQWAAWQDEVSSGNLTNTNGSVSVHHAEGLWRVTAADGVALVFNEVEWTAFKSGIFNREFETELVFA